MEAKIGMHIQTTRNGVSGYIVGMCENLCLVRLDGVAGEDREIQAFGWSQIIISVNPPHYLKGDKFVACNSTSVHNYVAANEEDTRFEDLETDKQKGE